MKAFVFPGQGAQFPGMGKALFEASTIAKEMAWYKQIRKMYKLPKILGGPYMENSL